jgi:hypothetical protein
MKLLALGELADGSWDTRWGPDMRVLDFVEQATEQAPAQSRATKLGRSRPRRSKVLCWSSQTARRASTNSACNYSDRIHDDLPC